MNWEDAKWEFLTEYWHEGYVPVVSNDTEDAFPTYVGETIGGYDHFGQYLHGQVMQREDEFVIVLVECHPGYGVTRDCQRLVDYYGMISTVRYTTPREVDDLYDPIHDYPPRFWRLA